MRLRLLADRVLVKLDALQETAADGAILLAYEAQDQPMAGVVLAAGPGFVDDKGVFRPTTLRPGDRVRCSIRPGHSVTIDGQAHVFAREFSSPQRYPGEGLLAVEDPA